jgi:hypothetical protein
MLTISRTPVFFSARPFTNLFALPHLQSSTTDNDSPTPIYNPHSDSTSYHHYLVISLLCSRRFQLAHAVDVEICGKAN